MYKSLLRRFINAIVLLGVISIIAFSLSKVVPGDEVLDYLSVDDSRYSSAVDPLQQRTAYSKVATKRGLNLPLFYFSVTPGYYPDSLYQIVPESDRKAIKKWVEFSRYKDGCLQFYRHLTKGLSLSCPQAATSELANTWCQEIGKILQEEDLQVIYALLLQFNPTGPDDSITANFETLKTTLRNDIEKIAPSPKSVLSVAWLPAFHWHGSSNQYHQWMKGLITFQPLTSLIDGRNAWKKILDALTWTLVLNGFAFLIAIALGIWIGIWSGTHDGISLERWINILLFALFAVPSFWLATLLIVFFSSGEWLSVFPTGGLGPYHNASYFLVKWQILATHLTLPVTCLALGSLAYVSRQMKQSVLLQLSQPYVMSLRAQGVSEKTIIRKHIIKNALFPMITLIGGALPALLSGSLIIEVIFSIPGMGRLMYTSLLARDWPVVFPILMFGAAITVISYNLTDFIYKWADPRVKSIDP